MAGRKRKTASARTVAGLPVWLVWVARRLDEA